MGNSQNSHGPTQKSSPDSFEPFLKNVHRRTSEFIYSVENVLATKPISSGQKAYIVSQMVEAERWLHGINSSLGTHQYYYQQQQQQLRQQHLHHQQQMSSSPNQKQYQPKEKQCSEIDVLRKENQGLVEELDKIRCEVDYLKMAKKKLQKEKDQLLLRLSKAIGEKLTKDNPNIADLSDRHRPARLGEMYTQLYDDEWTNAFEALTKSDYSEDEAVETLKLTLVNAVEFCKNKSEKLVSTATDSVNHLFEEFKYTKANRVTHGHFTMKGNGLKQITTDAFTLPNKWKPKASDIQRRSQNLNAETVYQKDTTIHLEDQLRQVQKDMAESIFPAVQKAYLKASWDSECIREMKPFIKKCLFLGWMMVVSSPPLCFPPEPEPMDPIDTNMYREYTSSGKHVKFVVWPALLLYEGGSVLTKGVVQGDGSK